MAFAASSSFAIQTQTCAIGASSHLKDLDRRDFLIPGEFTAQILFVRFEGNDPDVLRLWLHKFWLNGIFDRMLKVFPRARHMLISPATSRDENRRSERRRLKRHRKEAMHLFQALRRKVRPDCELSFCILP